MKEYNTFDDDGEGNERFAGGSSAATCNCSYCDRPRLHGRPVLNLLVLLFCDKSH